MLSVKELDRMIYSQSLWAHVVQGPRNGSTYDENVTDPLCDSFIDMRVSTVNASTDFFLLLFVVRIIILYLMDVYFIFYGEN